MFTPFYQKWWKDLGLVPLVETKANCSSCTMVKPPQNETLRDPGPFDVKLKCCTYFPFVPNFSLGSIAAREGGRTDAASVFKSAFARGLLSPLGLFPREQQRRGRVGFGIDVNQRCPFLSDAEKSCRIWSSRPSVCASYFCVSSQGSSGLQFWSKAEELGNEIEWTVAHEALWACGFTSDETAEMLLAVQSGDEDRVARSWLEWRGRELELFEKCLSKSAELTVKDLRESLGESGEALIRELQCATA